MAVLPEKRGTFVKVERGKRVHNSVARADSVWLSHTSDELWAQEYPRILLYLGRNAEAKPRDAWG